jgi:uncharacterized protein YndB with AHSA1/START domain
MTTSHVHQIYIRAEIGTVWNAIIDPAFTRQYFFGTAFDGPPVAGREFRSLLPDGSVAVDGVIEELEPPQRLVHTWRVRYDDALADEPASRVTWTLTEAGEGLTLLRVVHGDLAFSPLTSASVGSGWPYVLDGLKSLVETGAALPPRYPDAAAPEAAEVAKDWHLQQASRANNAVFDLLEAEPFDAEAALRGAYAAAFHWDRVASKQPANEVRALYLIGRAWLAAGAAEVAFDYGDRCLGGCLAAGLGDFDLAYAHELRARALHALGREAQARRDWAEATSIAIADHEDREIVERDFAVSPWD